MIMGNFHQGQFGDMKNNEPPNATSDDVEEFEEAAESSANERCPTWLLDLRRSSHQRGFYQSLGDHALIYTDRASDQLVISFDNLSSVRDDTLHRDPWGYSFVAKAGWSQLGVLAFRPNWFRDPVLFAALKQLADTGFFAGFRKVTLTGTSMGGYGACAFASLIPGATVIAFSPQVTLKKELVPWEKRFSSGRKADWSGPYADADAEVAQASDVWLFYDPRCADDLAHINRFQGPNIRHLKMRHAGHKTAFVLRRSGLLSSTVRDIIEGRMTEKAFYASYRSNRRLPWFLNAVADHAADRDRPRLIGRMVRFLHANGQGFAAHGIRKKHLLHTTHDPLHR